jgi:phenylalanyl-tRNA synthetase beta chain
MNISLEWLREYLNADLTGTAAGDALTNGGLPVEVITQVGNDTVIDVEVTSNRGDCLSHLGVARELSALLQKDFIDLKIGVTPSTEKVFDAVKVTIENLQLCPHYSARVIRNVKIGPSPDWMKRRLEAIGVRSINNVVDVTNCVMFEMGQPLHAFDYNKVKDAHIIVREAKANEKLTSIDGHERKLTAGMLVIADASGPIALAGVMGGIDSEVSDKTVNILLESARFDPLSIRKTARALAMKSDSSYRFERGIDPTLPVRASLRACQLIQQVAGGEILDGTVEGGSGVTVPKSLTVRLDQMARLLGVELPLHDVLAAYTRLGLSPRQQGNEIQVHVPPHRLDLNIEVDLIEEAARVIGYDKIPMRDEISIRLTPEDLKRRSVSKIRETLVASGYFESVTFSFVSDLLKDDFTPEGAGTPPRADSNVRKADAQLRPSILPGLLESVRHNESNGTSGAKLYEIGSTFCRTRNGAIEEHRKIGIVGSSDLREVRGTVEAILTALDSSKAISVGQDSHAGFDKSACGRVYWNGLPVGYLGKIDKPVADKLSLRDTPCAAELELRALAGGAQHVPQLKQLPKFPAVRRDLSLVVSETIPFDAIDKLVRSVNPAALEDLEYVTTYRGKPLDKGTKSVTVTLVFRSPNSTLTSESVDTAVNSVVDAAKNQLQATLRT